MVLPDYRRIPVFHFRFHPLLMWLMNLGVGLQRIPRLVRPAQRVRHTRVNIARPDGTQLRARVLRPAGLADAAPLLLYLHGGAFALSYSAAHIDLCEQYVAGVGCVVLLVDYRLAPRHPFPAAFDDAFLALQWVLAQAPGLGVDAGRVGVAGDSAGGALAAGVAHKAHDLGMPIQAQLLVYPVVDDSCSTASATQFDNVPLWTATSNRRMWAMYLGPHRQSPPQYAVPARRQHLVGLPPTYVETAEYDPLRDEGRNYAQALRAAGVHVTTKVTQGSVHGFDMVSHNSATRQAVAARIQFLKQWLHP